MRTTTRVLLAMLVLFIAGGAFLMGKIAGEREVIIGQPGNSQIDVEEREAFSTMPFIVGTIERVEGEAVWLNLYGYNTLPSKGIPLDVIETKKIFINNSTRVIILSKKEGVSVSSMSQRESEFPFSEESASIADIYPHDRVSVQLASDNREGDLYAVLVSIFPNKLS